MGHIRIEYTRKGNLHLSAGGMMAHSHSKKAPDAGHGRPGGASGDAY